MIKRTHFFSALCCAFFWAFSLFFNLPVVAQNLNLGKIDSSSVQKLRMDPQLAVGVKTSELFNKVEYIPLETTKESLFGRITSLRIVDDNFVVFDQDIWSILVFKNNGKFVSKITSLNIAKDAGLGIGVKPGHVFLGMGIVQKEGKSLISVIVRAVKQKLLYDLAGKLVEKSPYDVSESWDIYFNDGSKIQRYYTKDKEGFFEIALHKEAEPELFFPMKMEKYENEDNHFNGDLFTLGPDTSKGYFIDLYSYDVFEVNPIGVKFKYQFVLPFANSLPVDFKSKNYNNKRWETIKANRQMVYNVADFFQRGDNLYFKFSYYLANRNNKNILSYDLKKNKLIALQYIEPDELSSYLPVSDAAVGNDFNNSGFKTTTKDHFYNVISAMDMFKLNGQNNMGDKLYTPVLKQFFKGNQDANPVVVKLTPNH